MNYIEELLEKNIYSIICISEHWYPINVNLKNKHFLISTEKNKLININFFRIISLNI